MSLAQPLASKLGNPLSRKPDDPGGRSGRPVRPGDYLTDESANYLTDELGNRLTG